MKAKEYVKMCEGLSLQGTDSKVLASKLIEIDKMFMGELSDMLDTRGKSASALIGVVNELENKWISFSKKVDFAPRGHFRKRVVEIDKTIAVIMCWI